MLGIEITSWPINSFLDPCLSPGFKSLLRCTFISGFSPGPELVQQLPEISAISVHHVELVRKGWAPGEQEQSIDLNPSFLIGPAGNESSCLVLGGARTTLGLFRAEKYLLSPCKA